MKTYSALLIAMTLLSTCHAVPIASPKIDGQVEPKEWQGAKSYSTPSGISVRIRKQDDLLFVAVSGPSAGYPTLFIASSQSIEVLHASAALGSITYHRINDTWRTGSTKFNFELRQGAAGQQPSNNRRMGYFQRHGWLSTSSSDNSREREFMIRLRSNQKYVAVSFIEIPSLQIASWPNAANDDIRNQEILLGNAPGTLRFNLSTWYRIDQ